MEGNWSRAACAFLLQSREMRQLTFGHEFFGKLGIKAVEAKDNDALRPRVLPPPSSCPKESF